MTQWSTVSTAPGAAEMNPLDIPKKRVGKNFGRKINGKFLKIENIHFPLIFRPNP